MTHPLATRVSEHQCVAKITQREERVIITLTWVLEKPSHLQGSLMERLQSMTHVPRPREATSVAINMGERPALNSPRTQSRSRL
jgi:hypothetical protein